MNTGLTSRADGVILVDIENGRVLRCTQEVTCSQRYLDSHPFIVPVGDGTVRWLAGPDADRESRGVTNGGDFIRLEVISRVGGALTLRKDPV